MRILLVGDAYSIHVVNFIRYTLLKMDNIKEIVLFHFRGELPNGVGEYERFYEENNIILLSGKGVFGNNLENVIYNYNVISKMGFFDICHLHFLEYYPVLMGKLLRNNCGTLIMNYWGSDWFRASNDLRELQAELMRVADYVVTDSLQLAEQLEEQFEGEFNSKINYK